MIKLISGLHLTATQRRQIGKLIEEQKFDDDQCWRFGRSTLSYQIQKLDGDRYEVIVRKPEKDMWNRSTIRTSKNIISYS